MKQREKNGCYHNAKEYISNLRVYCRKIVPFVHYYKEQISSFNCTVHNVLTNEISLILPNLPKERKEEGGIITSLITGFIGLAYKGISSFMHNRRHKAVVAMDSMVMYGIYDDTPLEKLITSVHNMHNISTLNERLYAGKFGSLFTWYLTKEGVNYYAINTLLYPRMLREKYVKMYEEFIMQLCMYEKAIRILSKDNLPFSLIPSSK